MALELGRRWYPFGKPSGQILSSREACDDMYGMQSRSLAVFQEGGMSPGGDIFAVAFSLYLFI